MDSIKDNRMAWIRNIDSLQKGSQTYFTEYEIATETYIPGLFIYRNDAILCSSSTFDKDQRGLFKYTLKIKLPALEEPYYNRQASVKGYYFKEGIPGEILALFSLYFQCRFYMLAAFSNDLTPHSIKMKLEYDPLYRSCKPYFDPVVFSNGKRTFSSGLADFLNRIITIPMAYHQQIILACYHYARALKEFGVDEEMVFIRLVSAVEALSEWVVLKKNDDLFNELEFDDIVKTELLAKKQLQELKKLFDVRKSKLKFKRFIEQYSKGFFKGGNFEAPHTRIKKADLLDTLSAIYDSRSEYLHGGEAMYLSQPMRGGHKWDTDPSLGMIIDNRKFPRRKKLPYGSYFQRLVRYCLMEFIKDIAS